MSDLAQVVPVVLAGGTGSRLWPLSRALFPKQFLALAGERTMLQETLARLEGSVSSSVPLILCNEDHRFIVAEQLRQQQIQPATILLEPCGRNTAAAIAAAALHAMLDGGDPILLVLPADHVIQNQQAFHAALALAARESECGSLVTFGIKPVAPETGYGYLRAARDKPDCAWRLEQFIEKPDLATAQAYVSSGEYFWNSGMFMFRASAYLAELAKFQPAILEACSKAVSRASSDLDFIRLDPEAFSASPEDSIDYAVMEKTDKAVVVPLDAGWSDIGSWSALWEIGDKDTNGNIQRGNVVAIDNTNCYVHSSDGRLVATVGLSDMIVVDTDDAVLVSHKDQVQKVKNVVEALKARASKEARHHRTVYRPWGSYSSIDHGERYQVKRITVNPGARLSLQMHHHRAEHWVVVSGTAKVTNDNQEVLVTENQSIYIPLGTVHALENPGKIKLELIEVQTGTYLGEDDIVRLQDAYGRD